MIEQRWTTRRQTPLHIVGFSEAARVGETLLRGQNTTFHSKGYLPFWKKVSHDRKDMLMAHQPVDGEDQEQIDRNEQQVEAAGNIELPPPTQTDAERDEAQAAQVQALLEED